MLSWDSYFFSYLLSLLVHCPLLCSYHLLFSPRSLPPRQVAGHSLVGVQLPKPRQPFCSPKLVVFAPRKSFLELSWALQWVAYAKGMRTYLLGRPLLIIFSSGFCKLEWKITLFGRKLLKQVNCQGRELACMLWSRSKDGVRWETRQEAPAVIGHRVACLVRTWSPTRQHASFLSWLGLGNGHRA